MFEHVNEASSANKDTHTHRGYKKAYEYAINKIRTDETYFEHINSIDLFARKCQWADFRNDINPEYLEKNYTNSCMDALEFAETFTTNSIDLILFDPPFSDRQSNEKYGTSNLYTNPAYISQIGAEMFRILRPGGFIVKAGYNSNPPSPTMRLSRVILSRYHGCRNDVIFTVWQKVDMSLYEFS